MLSRGYGFCRGVEDIFWLKRLRAPHTGQPLRLCYNPFEHVVPGHRSRRDLISHCELLHSPFAHVLAERDVVERALRLDFGLHAVRHALVEGACALEPALALLDLVELEPVAARVVAAAAK